MIGTQHRVRVAVNGRIQSTVGTHVRHVTGGAVRRSGYAVDAGRVVPRATVPRSRPPLRHKAEGSQCGKTEHSRTCCRIAVHRLPVGIAEDRETIRIVAGARPSYRRIVPGSRHAYAAVNAVYGARAQKQSESCKYSSYFVADFHCVNEFEVDCDPVSVAIPYDTAWMTFV